jgi:hypothetical protein
MVGRLFWFVLFSGIIIAGSVLTYEFGPKKYRYQNDSFNYEFQPPQGFTEWAAQQDIILDQHSHTLYSDGVLTVEQNIQWHIAQGFNAMVLTDHDNIRNKRDLDSLRNKYKDQIVLIQGIEYTTGRIHMNILGITEWKLRIPDNPTDAQLQEAITYAHNQNAVVTVNHIPWSLRVGMTTHPTRAQLLEWGVDYIEIVNEYEFDNDSVDWINATNGFGAITGTDMHSPDRVTGWTGINTTSFTIDGIMTELRAKRTSIFYNETGSPDFSVRYDNPWYEVTKPLAYVGEMFEWYWVGNGLDGIGISVMVAYFLAAFFIAEGVRVANRRFWEKRNSKAAQ